jgi:predicted restriction endonuclease
MTWDKKQYEVLKKSVKSTLLNEVGKCESCGYSRFKQLLELAHIKHGYSLENLRISNLFLLCPTCHGEFDRGLIKVKGMLSDSQFSKRVFEIAEQNKQEVWKQEKTGEYRIAR